MMLEVAECVLSSSMSEDDTGRGGDHAFSTGMILPQGSENWFLGAKHFTFNNGLWTSKAYPYQTKSFLWHLIFIWG